ALVSALVGGLFVLLRHSGDVVLIAVDTTQANGFVPGTHDPHTPHRNNAPATLGNDPTAHGRVSGTQSGVYGRSGDGVTLDFKKILDYLMDRAHEAQAGAWAGVPGIAPADIPGYFARLTAVRLRVDTRVTNYDYKDGHADGFQAVLQAGTAVLVDNRGV